MARRSRSRPALTVALALVTGLSLGSNPSFEPMAWLRALLGRPADASSDPRPARSAEARAEAASPKSASRSSADTPELQLLRSAEPLLFPNLFGPGASQNPQLVSTLLGAANGLPPLSDFSDLAACDIDVPNQPEVGRYLRFFSQAPGGRALIERWLERRARYRPFVDQALQSEHLPQALEAIVLAESGYHPRATSTAGAVGLWQLMPQTARAYGLEVLPTYDERKDPQTASLAASKHLTSLRARLGEWELVLAAYNAGLDRVLSSLRQAGASEYWELARRPGALPRETLLYVPKVLALSLVLANLDTFGFKPPSALQTTSSAPLSRGLGRPGLTPLSPPDPGRGSTVLSDTNGDSEDFFDLAPPRESRALALLRTPVAASSSGDRWLLERVEPADVDDDRLSDSRDAPMSGAASERIDERHYSVVTGDTLSKISIAFGIRPELIARHNLIENPALIRPGQELRIPTARDPRSPDTGQLATIYYASPGDSLSKIARSFGVSERQLILDNDLKNPEYVREGQILHVRVPAERARSYLEPR